MPEPEYPSIPGVDFDAATDPVDREQIEMLLMADDDEEGAEMVNEIYGLFCSESRERLETLPDLCAAGDAAGVRKLVHFIAGSAGNLGMARLAGFYRAVERAIDAGRLSDVSGVAGPLTEAFEIGCRDFEGEFATG